MRTFTKTLGISAIVVLLAATLHAQALVTSADLTRLETTATEIETLAATLAKTDATQAAEVRASLKDASEEIAYLKVKLRKEGRVTREEYAAVRDRLETLRIKTLGSSAGKVTGMRVPGDEKPIAVVVPVGTEIDMRLQSPLNSGTAKVEQRFEGTTLVDVSLSGNVLIPAGSIVRGFVSSVHPASRTERKGSLTLSFDELRIDERSYRLRASVVKALDAKMANDVTTIGAGAVVGGIVGGILGGGKGAVLGVLVGGGGTMAATDGTEVDLPLGTVLRIRVDQPVEISVR
jgi:hypothetical protein